MRAAVETVEREHGAVGVLVNNAGYSQGGPIEQVPLESVRRQFETNVFGLIALTQMVLPAMRAQHWGKIVNIGSMGGRLTLPGGGLYHATKHSLEAISDALRFEVRGFGVDVVLVEPGLITTEFGKTAIGTVGEADATGTGGTSGSQDESGHEGPTRDGGDPYKKFNAKLAAMTAGVYEGPMRHLGGGPDVVAKAIEKAITTPQSAFAHAAHSLGASNRVPAQNPARPAVGRDAAHPDARAALGRKRLHLAAWTANLEALGVVDAVAAQQAHRGLVADVLRNRLLAHPTGHADERLHDQLVLVRAGQRANEVAVDLQVAEGELLEVLKGAEARAEVVQRNRAAERVHAFAESLGPAHVPDRGGLGDLDDQALGGNLVADQLPLDVGEHALVCDRQSRQVDGNSSLAVGQLAAHQRDDLADHHAIDLLDQPVALGRRQERARWR